MISRVASSLSHSINSLRSSSTRSADYALGPPEAPIDPSLLSLSLSAALLLAGLVGLTELFRRQIGLAAVGYGIAFAALFPLWQLDDWFRIVKVVSILGPVCYINALRLGARAGAAWAGRPWVSWSLYGVAAVNIAEIGLADLLQGRPANALAAALLVACMPSPRQIGWGVDAEAPHDWRVGFSAAWVLLYTSWNACFTYAEIPEFPLHTAAMLLAPLVYLAVGRVDRWAIARAYTLGACLFVRGTSESLLRWATPWDLLGAHGAQIWGIANAALIGGYLLYLRARARAEAK